MKSKKIQEQLEFSKAILIQLRETRLFNSMIDQAIRDIEELVEEEARNEA